MKLLVAGDSFGEFAHFQGYFTRSGVVTDGHLIPNGEKEFKHWCELIAEHAGGSAVSAALQGASISLSSFVAMQELVKDNSYTHVINFVSHHLRTEIQDFSSSVNKESQWREQIDPVLNTPILRESGEEIGTFYNSYNLYVNVGPELAEEQPISITKRNAQDIGLNAAADSLLAMNAKVRDHLTHTPPFHFVHSNIGHVLTMDNYCKANNIKIMHVNCFADSVLDVMAQLNITVDRFDMLGVEKAEQLECLHDWPSHYDGRSHRIFAEHFLQQHSNFLSA